jgi:tetratricopeptide (TPR) repeat protein
MRESDADGDAPARGRMLPEDVAHDAETEPAWANLWQVPTILLSIALIALAFYVAFQRVPENDFDGVLDEVEQLIAATELGAAGQRLVEVLEPNIPEASRAQRARFHACVADWVAAAQQAERVDLERNNLRISDQYGLAVELGMTLNARRTEQWGQALVSLGRLEEARARLGEIDRLDFGDGLLGEVRERRARLFRRYIQAMLAKREPPEDDTLRMIAEYRVDPRNSLAERIWAMARQAEIIIEAGQPQQAIERLLIDMRLVEYESGDRGAVPQVGEMLVLLGRAYVTLGQERQARFHLDVALERLGPTSPFRAEALVLLGQLAMGRDELDDAVQYFDMVVRDFGDTPSHAAALLGRAETRSLLGDHDAAQADFGLLAEQISRHGSRGVTPARAAASLIDRHDALLAQAGLETALAYIAVAERLFPPTRTPADVLLRRATTGRQLADNLVAQAARIAEFDVGAGLDRDELIIDPAARYEANRHYEQAAAYFIRHARSVAAAPTEGSGSESWADSLYRGAESFDRAGLHDEAIRHFEEYLAGRSIEDPRRADVSFQLARCHKALQQYESAVAHFERLLREHPRSVLATRSHVPLARCYMALGRRSEAEQQLRRVLSGGQPLQPDAADFREALFELGAMHYRSGRYDAAIPPLDEAVNRYPDHPRINEVRFRLADSYRGLAMQAAERLRESTADSPGERRRIDGQRRGDLRTALSIFETVIENYERRASGPGGLLGVLERDLLRTAQIHRADSTYHLGHYEQAIQLYDQTARRYADHHSSMHALVQIVNACVQLGDEERALAAHRRALVRLHQLRDDAFQAHDALMDRSAWERWLENAPVIPLRSASAGG